MTLLAQGPLSVGAVNLKSTDIGLLPTDWDVKRIEEIATVKGGKRLPKGRQLQRSPNEHPYIRVSDMYQGGVDTADIRFVPEDVAPQIRAYRIFAGDLFISVAGTLGLVGRLPTELDGANLTENADRLTELKCSGDFLFHVLSAKRIQDEIQGKSTVGAQPKLAIERIKQFQIPIPPLREQRAIAEALGDVDALIAAQEKLIAKKRAIKTATMQRLLTGKQRLPGFGEGCGHKQTEIGVIPEDWEVVGLGQEAEIKTGPFGSSLHESDYVREGVPIITVEHLHELGIRGENAPKVSEHDYQQLSAYRLKRGDIVFSRVGSVDRNALVRAAEDGWLFSGRLLRVRPNQSKISSSYLSYHFHSEGFKNRVRNAAVGQTMASLNTAILSSLQICFPSQREQEQIAAILNDLDKDILCQGKRLTKTKSIKQGMMQELLTGRTRLV